MMVVDHMEQTVLVHYEDQHGHAQHLLWYTSDVALLELRLQCGLGPGLSALSALAALTLRLFADGTAAQRPAASFAERTTTGDFAIAVATAEHSSSDCFADKKFKRDRIALLS